MKHIVSIFIIGIAATSVAYACDQLTVAQACFKIEQSKPDSSRGGVTASEYCAAQAVVQCSR